MKNELPPTYSEIFLWALGLRSKIRCILFLVSLLLVVSDILKSIQERDYMVCDLNKSSKFKS